jgi:putative ABC transport system permease protein
MLRFTPYLLKTLWRHRSRTMLTVSGSAVALFVFCFVGAIQEGMNELADQQQADSSLIVFQANKFCPATSHLPQDYERTIARIEGVREVVPMQVFTNNCRASLDVVVFYGLPAERIQRVRDLQLTAGDWSEFRRHQDGALVGRRVAERRRLPVGGKFSIGEVTVTVAGIFASPDSAEENYTYTHLDFLQRRRSRNLAGTVTQFEVLLDPGAAADHLCGQIDQAFRGGPAATDTRPKGAFQASSLGDLSHLIGLTHYLALACVGLVLALVATTTFMAVQDRIREHAVLQTIGFSGRRVFALVLAESVLLSVAGGVLGVGGALAVLTWKGFALGAEAVTISFVASPRLAAIGLAIAALTGIAAGILPAWQAARIEIVRALRNA